MCRGEGKKVNLSSRQRRKVSRISDRKRGGGRSNVGANVRLTREHYLQPVVSISVVEEKVSGRGGFKRQAKKNQAK